MHVNKVSSFPSQSNNLISHRCFFRLIRVSRKRLYKLKGEKIEIFPLLFSLIPLIEDKGFYFVGEWYAWAKQGVNKILSRRPFLEAGQFGGGQIRHLSTGPDFYDMGYKYMKEHLSQTMKQLVALERNNIDAVAGFIEQKQSEMRMVMNHTRKVEKWKMQQEEERAIVLERAKIERKEMLVALRSWSEVQRTTYYSAGFLIIWEHLVMTEDWWCNITMTKTGGKGG